MKQYWQQLSEKYLTLALRERLILLCTLSVLIIFTWLHFYFDVAQKQQKNLQQQISVEEQGIATLAEQLDELTKKLENDPNQVLRAEQRQLNAQLATLNDDIDLHLKGLLAPEQMLDVLRSLVTSQKNIRLLSVRNLPAEPYQLVNTRTTEGASAMQEQEKAAIYSHQMELVLEGDYFSVVGYLQLLEQQSGFYLNQLNYEVTTYPHARVTMRVSTLSLEEAWIGV